MSLYEGQHLGGFSGRRRLLTGLAPFEDAPDGKQRQKDGSGKQGGIKARDGSYQYGEPEYPNPFIRGPKCGSKVAASAVSHAGLLRPRALLPLRFELIERGLRGVDQTLEERLEIAFRP